MSRGKLKAFEKVVVAVVAFSEIYLAIKFAKSFKVIWQKYHCMKGGEGM